MNNLHLISAVFLGIGLSASSGFRVFTPLLIVSICQYMGWFQLGESFEWLSSLPAIITLSIATIVEIGAYYVPIVDNALDTIAGPLALIAGAILATAVIPIEDTWMRWCLGIIIGSTSAGTVHAGTMLTRAISSKTTLGAGNPVVSTTENVGAIGGTILSMIVPVIMGSAFLIFIIYILKRLYSWMMKRSKASR